MANQVAQYRKKNNYKKKMYPAKFKHGNYPRKSGPMVGLNGFFNGNLAQNMKFGAKDHELSGFVRREVFIRDQYGNTQRMREQQFFNSGNRIGKIRINKNEADF